MNRKTLFGTALIILCVTAAFGDVSRPNLIPLPKRVEPLEQPIEIFPVTAIICPQQNEPIIRTGVQATLRAFTDHGSSAARIVSEESSEDWSRMIIVGTPGGSAFLDSMIRQYGLAVTPSNPGPQGYVVHFRQQGKRWVVLLIGSDAQGALYACVTFTQMLRRAGDRVMLDAANVRDWPDFRRRKIGRPKAPSYRLRTATNADKVRSEYQRYVKETKAYVDFCLRYKINYCSLRSGGTRTWSNVQSIGPVCRAALREVTDYARERGIRFAAPAYSAIDIGQGGPVSQLEDIVRTHGVGYCWSRDAMLRAQAREFAAFAHDAGIGLYYLHAPDRTSVDDPARFKERCALCKTRWKDDERAKADAHVMNIMYDEIRKRNPQTDVCAVLVPYGATLDRLDDKTRQAIVGYWREASSLLPEDMLICVRENRRPNVAAFKAAFARQPIYFYIESVYWRGWAPLFTTTPRMIQTFDFDDPRDLYYLGNRPDFAALAEIMAAHYAWNTHAPGAGRQRPYNHDPTRDGREPREVTHDLLDAVAARMFGDAAGPSVAEAVRGDISWSFTDRPRETATRAKDRLAGKDSDIPGLETRIIEELDDETTLMRRQMEGSSKGYGALVNVARKLGDGEIRFNRWQRDQFNFLLSYCTSVYALSALRHPALEAVKAIHESDYARAEKWARAGLAAAEAAPGWIHQASERIGGMENWYANARKVPDKVRDEKARLERLWRLSQGVVLEAVDTAENLEKAAFLLRRNVRTHSAGNGTLELTDERGRTPRQKALLYTRPERPWNGCSVSFDPVDIRPYLAQNGYLRFYVNSAGPRGWHRATLIPRIQTEAQPGERPSSVGRWVYLHPPLREERQRNDKPGFVEVDDLPQTWQLVSIPLRELVEGEGAAYFSGWHLNFTAVPDCGLILADPYVIANVELIAVERRIRR